MPKLFENDDELSNLIDKLVKNQKVLDLVKIMKPLDVAKIIQIDLSLQPEKAANFTAELFKQTLEAVGAGPNIETNKNFPVPASIRGDNQPKGEEQDDIEKAINGDDIVEDFINNLGQLTPTFSQDQFPEPSEEPTNWPYDGMTKAIMAPKNRQPKRGVGGSLTNSKIKKYVFTEKPPFKQDLRVNQPGGDAHGGLQQKMQGMDNDQSSSGTSWSTRGRPGWSKAMGTFEVPDELPQDTLENTEDEKLPFEDPAPVGSPIPNLKGSGRFDGANFGPRKGFRRR